MVWYLLGVTAGLPGLGVAPEVVAAGAAGASESDVFKNARRVELLGVRLEFRTRQSFDLLITVKTNQLRHCCFS